MKADVVVVGAGPGGITAAVTAAEAGASVLLVDDNPAPGGQIWRGKESAPQAARRWLQRLESSSITHWLNCQVVAAPDSRTLLAVQGGEARWLHYGRLILATGARERFLPFPGWTLPNVMGIGGLQALVKGGLDVGGKQIVLCGTGPLLLAVAATLRKRGAELPLVAEQAPLANLLRFLPVLRHQPAKMAEALQLGVTLAGAGFRTGCVPVRANGGERVSSVLVRSGGMMWSVPCDYLACAFGLVPNMELPRLLGCAESSGFVRVDHAMRSSVADVFAVGELTGIGGAEKSVVEGRIAGYAATGADASAAALRGERERALRFADALEACFAPRAELRSLASDDTIVCRCEDVSLGDMQGYASSREAKLQTRCGMGRCQGRICGSALEFLKGWEPASVRPPLFPVPAAVLMETMEAPELSRSAK